MLKLPTRHNRRLYRKSGLMHYFLWCIRTGGLNLEPPSSCRDFVTAYLAAERAYSCPN